MKILSLKGFFSFPKDFIKLVKIAYTPAESKNYKSAIIKDVFQKRIDRQRKNPKVVY